MKKIEYKMISQVVVLSCEVYDNDKNQISIFDIDISLKEKINVTLGK